MEWSVSRKTEITEQHTALTHKNREDDATGEAYGKPFQPGVETEGRGVQDLRKEEELERVFKSSLADLMLYTTLKQSFMLI